MLETAQGRQCRLLPHRPVAVPVVRAGTCSSRWLLGLPVLEQWEPAFLSPSLSCSHTPCQSRFPSSVLTVTPTSDPVPPVIVGRERPGMWPDLAGVLIFSEGQM